VVTFLAYRMLVYPFLAALGLEITPQFPVVLVGTLFIAVLVDWSFKRPAKDENGRGSSLSMENRA